MELENYFLSENELKGLENSTTYSLTYTDYLFKLALLIMNLGIPEVKIRNY